MVIRRMATRGTAIHRTVTAIVRIVIHTMGGTIPGLGTATVRMDSPTIGDRVSPPKPYRLDRALRVLVLFFSHNIVELLAQYQPRRAIAR
jgi:hypothetical protein